MRGDIDHSFSAKLILALYAQTYRLGQLCIRLTRCVHLTQDIRDVTDVWCKTLAAALALSIPCHYTLSIVASCVVGLEPGRKSKETQILLIKGISEISGCQCRTVVTRS